MMFLITFPFSPFIIPLLSFHPSKIAHSFPHIMLFTLTFIQALFAIFTALWLDNVKLKHEESHAF